MSLLSVALLVALVSRGWAQQDTIPAGERVDVDFLLELSRPDSVTGARVAVFADPRLEEVVRLRQSINRQGGAFTGYRVQILSQSSYQAEVDSLRAAVARFEEEFPEYRAYLQYFDPDFKIRVGDFHSRVEALPALARIREKYPAAYPVKTTILLKDLLPVVEPDTTAMDTTRVLEELMVPVERGE